MEKIYELENPESLNLIQRITAIYTDPKRAFESLKEKPKFFGVYLIGVLITSIAILWSYLDGSTEKLMIDSLVAAGQPVNEQTLTIITITTVIGGLLVFIFGPFISAFIYHILVMINSETGYKKTLAITTHSTMISALNSVITLLILKVTGITLLFSPAMFLDVASTGPILYSLFSFLNIFIIWQIFVNIIGFKTVHNMPTKNAIITTLCPTILSLIISILVLVSTT